MQKEKENQKQQTKIRCDFCHRLITFEEAEEVSIKEHHRPGHGYCHCGNHLFSTWLFGGKKEVCNV
jgi:hypothetical protein